MEKASGLNLCSKPQILRYWFKAADTTAVTLFLQDFLTKHIETLLEEDAYLESILECCKVSNLFMATLYRAGLWLKPEECRIAAQCGLDFLRSYKECAQIAYNLNKTRFKIQPKYHAMMHVVDGLCHATEHKLPFAYNPLGDSTQLDEDFIGRVAQLSTAVSSRTAHCQTISRYLVNALEALRAKDAAP